MATRASGYLLAAAIALSGSGQAIAHGSHVKVTVEDGSRVIRSNGIPDHPTGNFPNRGNPNSISEQDHVFRVPADPKPAGVRTPLRMNDFGVALNGVPFDPSAAEFWNDDRRSGWQYEALSGKVDLGMDGNNAHVQPNGAYHYHGLPKGYMSKVSPDRHSPLIGYAADGFPIYALYGYADAKDPSRGAMRMRSSWRLRAGVRPSGSGPGGPYDGTFVQDWEYRAGAGDLDESNARFTVTPEYPNGTYAYFLTEEFPFVPRSFVGTPDPSFAKGPGTGRGMPPRGARMGGMGPGGMGPGGPGDPPPFGRPPPFGGPPPWDRR